MSDTTYNGWSNRATWNVSLWLNNDEGSYHELAWLVRRADSVEELAEGIEALCREMWADSAKNPNYLMTPDGDRLSECAWEEIAQGEWDDAGKDDDRLNDEDAEVKP
jgi:hypothetical protein